MQRWWYLVPMCARVDYFTLKSFDKIHIKKYPPKTVWSNGFKWRFFVFGCFITKNINIRNQHHNMTYIVCGCGWMVGADGYDSWDFVGFFVWKIKKIKEIKVFKPVSLKCIYAVKFVVVLFFFSATISFEHFYFFWNVSNFLCPCV